MRITRVERDQKIALTVDGRTVAEDVEELLRVLAESREPTTLELGGVQFVDSRAASALRHLQAKGVRFVGASPFIRLLPSLPGRRRADMLPLSGSAPGR